MKIKNGIVWLADGRQRQDPTRPGYLVCDGDWTIQLLRRVAPHRGWELWANVPRLERQRSLKLWRLVLRLNRAVGYRTPMSTV